MPRLLSLAMKDRDRRDRREHRAWGPVALALFIVSYGLWQANHLGGAFWDTDEGLNVIKAYLVQGGAELYSEVWADQPPGLTQLLAWSFDLFAPTMEVARAVVLAHALILLVAVAWIVREAGGGWPAAIGAAALVAFAPNFFWASRAVMIGLPALSLAVLSIAMAMAYARNGRRSLLLAGGLVFGIGLLEKLIGLYLVVPIAIAVWGRYAGDSGSEERFSSGLDRSRAFVVDGLVMALGAASVLVIALLAYDTRAMIDQAIGTVISARDVPEYALDRAWSLDKLAFWLFGEHRYLIGPAAIGVYALLRERSNAAAVLLTWLVLTLVALLNQAPLWPKHHFLALLVVLAPLAGVGLDRGGRAVVGLFRRWRVRSAASGGRDYGPHPFFVLCSIAALSAMLHGIPDAYRGDVMRLEAAPFKENGELPESDAWTKLDAAVELVKSQTAPDDYIVTDHGVLAFRAGRRVPTELAVISGKRLAVGRLTAERLIEVTREGIVRTTRSRVPLIGRSDEVIMNLTGPGQPAAVIFWDGDRLSRIPEFADWVRANYELAATIDDDYELWLRPEAP